MDALNTLLKEKNAEAEQIFKGKDVTVQQTYAALEVASEALQQLTLRQIANGMRYFIEEDVYDRVQAQGSKSSTAWSESNCQPLSHVSAVAITYLKTCRFYQSLAPKQRILVLTTGVPAFTLNETQRQRLGEVAPALASTLTAPNVVVRMRLVDSPLGEGTVNTPEGEQVSDVFGNPFKGLAKTRMDIISELAQP